MIRQVLILFLLLSTASAGLYQLPNTYVNGSLNVKNASTLNATDINGATTAENISLTQGKRIVLNTAGTQFIEHNTSGNYFGIWGNPLAVDGFRWTGTLAPTSGSDMVATGGGSDLDYSASTGFTNTTTGTNNFNGDVVVASGKTATAPDVTVTNSFTMSAGSTGTLAGIRWRGISSDDNYSIDTSYSGFNTFLVGNASEDQLIELDGAANTTNMPLMFMVVRNPGSHDVIIDGEDSETIAGNGQIKTTDNYATLTLISDGTEYYILSSNQTWTT